MVRTKQASLKRNDVINASEIGQYAYCSVAWFLQRCGHEPDSPLLEVGKKIHIDLGNTIDDIQVEMRRSRMFARIGYLLLIVAIIVFLFEVVL